MRRIYIVEDEALVVLDLTEDLTRRGYQVCGHATRAEEALEAIPRLSPDLVIMDVNLGPGLSGLDVAERLKPHAFALIFLTAYADEERLEDLKQSGSSAYLTKPLRTEVLAANIELALVKRRSAQELASREDLLRLSQEVAQVGSWEWNLRANTLQWSPEMYRLHGKAPATFVPTLASALASYLPEDRQRMVAGIERSVATGEGTPECFRVRLPDGTVRTHWVAWKTFLDATGKPERMIGANVDVTERRRAEEALQRTEALLSSVFEFAPDALLITNDAGDIIMANQLATALLGYGHDEFLRLSVEALVPEGDRARHADQRREFTALGRQRHMGSTHARLWAKHKDGRHLPVEISLSPITSDQGRLVVAAIRDVSSRLDAEEARYELERRLGAAQKMEALGRLAGGIVHDFNNLLTSISANLYLAGNSVTADSPLAECLTEIGAATNRATELVRQILTLSRRQPSRHSAGRVRPLVEEVVRLLRVSAPPGVRLGIDAPEDGLVAMNPTEIHQVLMNLGSNAVHAVATTGQVSFRVRLEVADGSGALRPGRYLRIDVVDDGQGMAQEIVEQIFEPFFTTKPEGRGTGLGLAVVHGIIEAHHGRITVDTELGRGTRMSVFLPEAK